jgi:hypothetical protein
MSPTVATVLMIQMTGVRMVSSWPERVGDHDPARPLKPA